MVTGKIIYIDIDETICESPDAPDYTSSKPIVQNIDKANQLYDQGNTIIYWTARGSLSNQNLLKSGVSKERIFFVGNTMIDTLLRNKSRFKKPEVWNKVGLNFSSCSR